MVKPVRRRAVRWRRTDRRRASYRRQSRGRRRHRHVGSEFESAAIGPGPLFHRVGAIVRTGVLALLSRATSFVPSVRASALIHPSEAEAEAGRPIRITKMI